MIELDEGRYEDMEDKSCFIVAWACAIREDEDDEEEEDEGTDADADVNVDDPLLSADCCSALRWKIFMRHKLRDLVGSFRDGLLSVPFIEWEDLPVSPFVWEDDEGV